MPHGRLFRFFQWNDLHVRDQAIPGRGRGYPRCNEKAAWARSLVPGSPAGANPIGASGEPIEPPDFIVSAGDIVDGEIADYGLDFAYQRRHILDGLTVPFMPCLGNHENRQGEGEPAVNRAYDEFYG
ncbi:MAG: metallophosphoesterase, partial [Planctomycetota bacterium]|nr:metallophosphoesterase [Planctomycetota bacterium]